MKVNPTFFLIDDDDDDLDIFSMALEQVSEAANFITAKDGMEALNKINNDPTLIPDFIFIDMNMPRMNGKQCLTELRKVERLNHVPVYMYSTSSDAANVEESKKLGAKDFIIKPNCIEKLCEILSEILKVKALPLLFLIYCLSSFSNVASCQTDSLPAVNVLKNLSIEELMNIVVTSVSKRSEKLIGVPSSIQVVTGEEIKRSGVLRLPGALRLATNMQVGASGSHDWRISSRGFSGFPITSSSLSNKLLVLIDGRTVYTPLFGGVFWDVQNVLQEDLKQIEVISGPGGSIWGANAVNGIVNITSKSAEETQGLYVSSAIGSQLKQASAARYGGHIDSTLFYRIYAQRFDFNGIQLMNNSNVNNEWNNTMGGFRMDFKPSSNNNFTFQGDLYNGKEDSATTLVNGQNLIGRWTHTYSATSGLTLQTYFDNTYRNIKKDGFKDKMTTLDMDMQYNFEAGQRNKIIWGLGYRIIDNHIQNRQNDFVPAKRTLQLFSGFIQDQIALVKDQLELTLGTKILHNDYTNFEFQPTIRMAWTPIEKHTLWAAISRAVRTPTRLETDHPAAGLGSFGHFKSEKVIAYELGYRVRPVRNISISIATYFNRYTDLRSIDSNKLAPPVFYFANNLEANSYGFELSANAIATSWWKLRGGYTYLHKNFTITSPLTFKNTEFIEAIDPQNQFLIQSMMDVTQHFQVNGVIRYVSKLPQALTIAAVPAYITYDLSMQWQYRWFTVSLTGQNLADKLRDSQGTIKIPRSIYGKISLNF
ncbi:MAG: response regulator [Saprospiraceae bacterium]